MVFRRIGLKTIFDDDDGIFEESGRIVDQLQGFEFEREMMQQPDGYLSRVRRIYGW